MKSKNSSSDLLVEQVRELEQRLHHATSETALAHRQLHAAEKRVEQLETQARATHTLSLGVFTTLEISQIYSLVCESLVYQLGWDSAFVVTMHGGHFVVQVGFGATERQVHHLKDYIGLDTYFRQLFTSHTSLSTFHQTEKLDLALRSLFGTDELMAVPMQFADHLYGYLIVCAHSERGRLKRDLRDLDFLSTVASQVAHAAQYSASFHDLERQNLRLRQLDELKDSFISITSHQLRTPLSIIKWILSILQSDKAFAHLPEQLHMIDQAYESNERLIHVVNELLNVSRIQDGTLQHNPQLVDLGDILHDLYRNSQKLCANRSLTIEYEPTKDLPLLKLDPLLIKEAFQNLIDNAIDYNKDNGWIRLSTAVKSGEVWVTVANSGIGIAKEDQEKIFDQFFRSESALKLQPNGNGLGLFLVKAIIKAHEGQVSFESKAGDVTEFHITLPIPKD